MDDAALWDAFLRLHDGLKREAPGSEETTRRALAIAAPPADAAILDMGCGPGPASAVLLEALPGAHVIGVDQHAPYVHEAARRAEEIGAGRRFVGMVGDMASLPLTRSFDLIWCEGAAYAVGVEAALRAWAPLLHRVRGRTVCWLCSSLIFCFFFI